MIITRTPLRVSFFGGGTDYPAWLEDHDGAVLATTIDKFIYVWCRYLPPFFDHTIRLSYSKMEHLSDLEAIAHPAVRECLRYMGIRSNLEMHTDADLPARTGLGSSSAFTVGLLHALHAYKGEMCSQQQLAREATHVEQQLLGENVGCQDQILAAYGGLNQVKFNGRSDIVVSPIPLSQQRLTAFEEHLMLFFTGVSRDASLVAAEQLANLTRRAQALEQMGRLVDEGLRVLTSGAPWQEFGGLLHESWMLKRSLSPSISNPAIDEAYARARRAGAYGGKLLGAGGGGFLLVFGDPGRQPDIRSALAELLHVPVRLESSGSQIIFYRPNNRAQSD